MDPKILNQEFGNSDIILIDSILKERFHMDMRILDAGCGEGRNMVYFIRQHFNIYGIDKDQDIVSMARLIGRSLNPEFEEENVIHTSIEDNPFPDEFFNLVMCLNVMHFSEDKKHFFRMVDQLIRITCPGGMLFLSMESSAEFQNTGCPTREEVSGSDNGEERFLLDDALLEEIGCRTPLHPVFPGTTLYQEGHLPRTYLWFRRSMV